MTIIDIVNITAFGIALSFIVNGLYQSFKRFNRWKLFLILSLLESLAVYFHVEEYSMLPIVVIVALYIDREIDNFMHAFFISCTAMLMFAVNVIFSGSVLLLMIFSGMHTISYHLLMSVFVLLNGIMVSFFLSPKAEFSLKFSSILHKLFWFNNINPITRIIIVFIEMAIMGFLSIIFPLSLRKDFETAKSILYIGFSVLLFLLVSIFFILIALETKKIQLENEKLTQNILEKKYKNMMQLHHYYDKLYRCLAQSIKTGNLKQIEVFFNQYIVKEQIHNKLSEQRKELDYIHDLLIKCLLLDMIDSLERMNQNLAEFHITSVYEYFEIKNIQSITLFRILSIFIYNALEELEYQKNGYMNVRMEQSSEKTIIQIENTLCHPPLDIAKLYQEFYTTKQNHYGMGLFMAKSLISHYPNIEHLTYLNPENLFVQLLIIHEK